MKRIIIHCVIRGDKIMDQFIKLLMPFISGGIIGYLVKYGLDFKYAKKLEEMNKRRAVYEKLTETLGIFISGRISTVEQKNRFLDTYSNCWLWASDEVVNEISDFLDYQVAIAKGEKVEQEDVKRKYASCLIAMRRDLGFPKTYLEDKDYKFVSFS